jgi:anti-anti-sigma factor
VGTEGAFQVEQTVEPDGSVRLSLLGELDYVASESLLRRIDELKQAGDPVRLDLSRLDFIDSSGVRIILLSVRDARRDGWVFEVDRRVSSQVDRVFDVLGLSPALWPNDDPAS